MSSAGLSEFVNRHGNMYSLEFKESIGEKKILAFFCSNRKCSAWFNIRHKEKHISKYKILNSTEQFYFLNSTEQVNHLLYLCVSSSNYFFIVVFVTLSNKRSNAH